MRTVIVTIVAITIAIPVQKLKQGSRLVMAMTTTVIVRIRPPVL